MEIKIKRVKHLKYLVGIDEAGRGPLAGPITVAGVCCLRQSARHMFRNIKDSKKLSRKKREEWHTKIKNEKLKMKNCQSKFTIYFTTSSVSNLIIDRIGITRATSLAIERVIKNLKRKTNIQPSNCYIMLDGLLKAPKKYFQKTIVRGDEKIPIISAASIISKVTRDRKMTILHKKFPEYCFNLHKGYGTKLHYKMLRKFGLSSCHRRSYCGNIQAKSRAGVIHKRKLT